MSGDSFSFMIPFSKQVILPTIKKNVDNSITLMDTAGNMVSDVYIDGIASTIDVDRDTERMSEKALLKMKTEILDHPVNIFGNHEHEWENTLGVIKQADVTDRKFIVKFLLDDANTNSKIPALLNKLKKGISLGLSVGGKVLETKEEFRKDLGKKVTIIDDLELYEISIVGIPSNKECLMSMTGAIAKSLKVPEEKATVTILEPKDAPRIAIVRDGNQMSAVALKCVSCYNEKEFRVMCKTCNTEISY